MEVKKEKIKEKPKQKQQFIIKVEGTVPVTVEYRIWALDEDEAYNHYNYSPNSASMTGQPKFELNKLQKKKVSIRNIRENLIKWIKNF